MDNHPIPVPTWLAEAQRSVGENSESTLVLLILVFIVAIGVIAVVLQRNRSNVWKLKLQEAERFGKKLESDNADLRVEIQQETETVSSLTQQIAETTEKLVDSERSIQDLNAENQRIRQCCDERQAKIASLEAQLAEQLELIDQLQRQQQEQKEYHSEVTSTTLHQLAESERQHQVDRTQLDDMERDSAQFISDLNEVREQLRQLEAELKRKDEHILRLEKNDQNFTQKTENSLQSETDSAIENKESSSIGETQGGSISPMIDHSTHVGDENQLPADQLPEKLNSSEEDSIAGQRFDLVEQEHVGVAPQSLQATALESYFQRQNEWLLQLNQRLATVLDGAQSSKAAKSSDPVDKSSGMLKRLQRLLKPANQATENAEIQDESVRSVSLWQQHHDYIERLLGCYHEYRRMEQQQNQLTATIVSLERTIDEQRNFIDRLQYDLEIKKMLIKDKAYQAHEIPAEIIAKQEADRIRIETLENQLMQYRSDVVDAESGGQHSVADGAEQLQGKAKRFYRKWMS